MEQDSKFQANNSLENNSQGKVPFISKLAYGMGDVGCNFSWMFVGNFLMIFYTDVFGISMSAVATLMLVSRFWDAINDPIIGTLTDKTHTRWGRFRPWLLFGAPITALVLILTFWAHPEWSQTAKIIYKKSGAGHVKDKYTGVELDEVAGHSWIIDGYVIATLDDESHNVHVKDFYVHNNMGWDGANNGYNLLTALSSSPMAYKEGLLDLIWT